MSVAFFTNNPSLRRLFPDTDWLAFTEAGLQVLQTLTARAKAREKLSLIYFQADALPVLTATRDCIHAGWRLLHHPLYGNYRPYQQPFRSMLVKAPVPGAAARAVDETSLQLIEEALLVYAGNKVLAPQDAPASLLDACGLLDCELMRLPLEQTGILRAGVDFSGREGLVPELRVTPARCCA